MEAYITSVGAITPQNTLVGDYTCDVPPTLPQWHCIEPDYRELIPPLMLRRMPRLLKLSLGAAQMCINGADGCLPEGIIVGTGLACLNETETFMRSLFADSEKGLSPLPFINSPHNIIAGHIARMLKNHSYNCTHCSRNVSFESALIDAMMLINEGAASNVLVGGVDEVANHYHVLLDNAFERPRCGEGEGSVFFMLSKNPSAKAKARIIGAQTFYKPKGGGDIADEFLASIKHRPKDFDGLLLGNNGDKVGNFFYREVGRKFELNTHLAIWKHLCGEYMTATAFALALAVHTVQTGAFPKICLSNEEDNRPMKRILVVNHVKEENYAFMAVEAIER